MSVSIMTVEVSLSNAPPRSPSPPSTPRGRTIEDLIQEDRCKAANALCDRMILELCEFGKVSRTNVDICVSILEGKIGKPPTWETLMPESDEAIDKLMAKLLVNLILNSSSLTEKEATIQMDFLIKLPVDLYSYAYAGRLYARYCSSMLGIVVKQMGALSHTKFTEIMCTLEVNEECWKVDIPEDRDDPHWVKNWQDICDRVDESQFRRHRVIMRNYDV